MQRLDHLALVTGPKDAYSFNSVFLLNLVAKGLKFLLVVKNFVKIHDGDCHFIKYVRKPLLPAGICGIPLPGGSHQAKLEIGQELCENF